MTATVAQIAKISQELPAQKAEQVLVFARSLLPSAKGKAESRKPVSGNDAWEKIIATPRHRPKLEAVRKRLHRLKQEEKIQPFDFKRL